MKYRISGTGHFRAFTCEETGHIYNVPTQDILLVTGQVGVIPVEGETFTLSPEHEERLKYIHNQWEERGPSAAVRHNHTMATLGCVSWIVLLAVVAMIIWYFLS